MDNLTNQLSLLDINSRIQQELCRTTINNLSDQSLLTRYKESPSVIRNTTRLRTVLEKNKISESIQDSIINDFTIELVPPGTKGVVRGNKFNEDVKNFIHKLKLSKKRFQIRFEKNHSEFLMSEIPDWYIFDKQNKKILIGMNQLDLWTGGHQINRGSKYIVDAINTENKKLICVVCSDITIKSKRNKTFKIFDNGFRNNTLCYLNGLTAIINNFFEI